MHDNIKAIRITELIKDVLQARHDMTFNKCKADSSPRHSDFFNHEAMRAEARLQGALIKLSKILGIEHLIDLLIEHETT